MAKKHTPERALEEIREFYRFGTKISEAMGGKPSPQAIGQWKRVPLDYIPFFEKNGPKFSRYYMREDIYGKGPKFAK